MTINDYPTILFLDFDGVFNSTKFFANNPQAARLYSERELVLDPKTIAQFNLFLDRNPTAIVISSDWRKAYDYDVIRKIMNDQGFKHGEKIVDQTPNFGKQTRGREISAWMSARNVRKPYVILDDRSDMDEVAGRLVLTDPRIGITPNDFQKAEKILRTPL